MNIATIDLWIGKTLFLPPIIKLCQITRQSQYAISRLFWFIAALDQLRVADTLGAKILAAVFSIVMMLSASLRADMPAYSMRWFRMIAVAFLILDVVRGIGTNVWEGVEIWVLILFAEYAATIRTIPPAETKEKSKKLADSRSN